MQARYRRPACERVHGCVQVKGVASRMLGLVSSSAAASGATHVFCLGIGYGVHRAFLDGAPFARASTVACLAPLRGKLSSGSTDR